MSKLPRLRMFGILNHEMLKEMSDGQRRDFVQEDVKSALARKTMTKKVKKSGPFIAEDDETVYEVACDYTVIDIHYNEQGHLLAELTCQCKDGVLATLNSVTYQPK